MEMCKSLPMTSQEVMMGIKDFSIMVKLEWTELAPDRLAPKFEYVPKASES